MNTIVRMLIEKYFRYTAGALVVVVLVLGYFLVIQGQITSFRTNGLLQQSTVKNTLASDQSYLGRLQASVTKYKSTLQPQDLAAVKNFIPTAQDFPGLLLTIKGLADTANLSLDTISVGQAGATNSTSAAKPLVVAGLPLQAQDVSLTVSGGTSYDTFKHFLTLVEQSQRLMDVVSVSFSTSSAATTTTGTATTATVGAPYTLTVRTYYLATTSAAATTTTP